VHKEHRISFKNVPYYYITCCHRDIKSFLGSRSIIEMKTHLDKISEQKVIQSLRLSIILYTKKRSWKEWVCFLKEEKDWQYGHKL
jgi:hypothetical protein